MLLDLARRDLLLFIVGRSRRDVFTDADTSIHSSERVISAGEFILGNTVLFYFILKFSRFRVMCYSIENY